MDPLVLLSDAGIVLLHSLFLAVFHHIVAVVDDFVKPGGAAISLCFVRRYPTLAVVVVVGRARFLFRSINTIEKLLLTAARLLLFVNLHRIIKL